MREKTNYTARTYDSIYLQYSKTKKKVQCPIGSIAQCVIQTSVDNYECQSGSFTSPESPYSLSILPQLSTTYLWYTRHLTQ